MAVAVFGSISTNSGSATDPLDITHTVGTGQSDICLCVGGHKLTDSAESISEVRWDPVGDNELLTEDVYATRTNLHTGLYSKAPVTTGSGEIVRIDLTAAEDCAGGAINFSGVDQTTPISNATSEQNGSGNPNCTVTTNADSDDMVMDSTVKQAGTGINLTADASQTERWSINVGTRAGGGSTEGGGTNPTEMDWTHSATTDLGWICAGMLINAAVASVSRAPPQGDLTISTSAPTSTVPSHVRQKAFRFRNDGPIGAP